MKRAQIITQWERVLQAGVFTNRPKIIAQFTIARMTDVTGTPALNLVPDPNGTVVEVIVDDAVYDAILAHPDYGEESVLWSENA